MQNHTLAVLPGYTHIFESEERDVPVALPYGDCQHTLFSGGERRWGSYREPTIVVISCFCNRRAVAVEATIYGVAFENQKSEHLWVWTESGTLEQRWKSEYENADDLTDIEQQLGEGCSVNPSLQFDQHATVYLPFTNLDTVVL